LELEFEKEKKSSPVFKFKQVQKESTEEQPLKRKRGRPPKKKKEDEEESLIGNDITPTKSTSVQKSDMESLKKDGKVAQEEDLSGPEYSPKRQKLDSSLDSFGTPGSSSNSESPVKKVLTTNQNKSQNQTSQQKLWTTKLDNEMKRTSLRFQGTRSAYLIQNLEQICKRFLTELGNIPDESFSTVPVSNRKSKSKSKIPKNITAPNPKNLELAKKERIIKKLVDRLLEEEKEWEEIKKQNHNPKNKIVVHLEPLSKDSKEPISKVSVNKTLETLILQVDELKPALKEIKHFNTIAEKFCSDMATSLTNKGFASYGKADPKELIRSIAYAEDL